VRLIELIIVVQETLSIVSEFDDAGSSTTTGA
jgi:hypothetical protein